MIVGNGGASGLILQPKCSLEKLFKVYNVSFLASHELSTGRGINI